MTNTLTPIRTMVRQKASRVHMVVGIQLVATIISLIWIILKHQFIRSGLIGISVSYAMIAMFATFILLALSTERVWNDNFFRLIPISDAKLYLANIGSTFFTFIYFLALEIIINVIFMLTDLPDAAFPAHSLAYGNGGLVFALSLILGGWVLISLIHLIGRSLTIFLPEARHKLINLILYAVVAVGVFKLLGMATNLLNSTFSFLYTGRLNTDLINVLFIYCGFILVSAVIMSLINIYLLNKWVETKQFA